MANTLQIKRGLATNLPTLSAGEPAFTTDDGRFHVGDGSTNYNYYPGDQSAKTTDDVEFNTVTVSTAPSVGSDLTNKTYVDDIVSKGLTAHEVVSDKDTLDPSGLTPSDGDRYWIGGTGAVGTVWEGHDYEIADYNGASWDFETVTDGDMAFVDDEGVYYFYDATAGSLKKLNTAIGAHASTHESGGVDEVNHDSLTGFVANEHIDHTAVSITAGTGLTGGGTIASSRTVNVDVGIGNDKIVQMDDVDAADNDYAKFTANGLEGRSYSEVKTDLSLNNVPNEDATDPANWDPANTDGNFLVGNGSTFVAESGSIARASMGAAESGGAEHDGFSDFVANEHINHTSVTLTAGDGLSGGGDISANRTFNVDINGTADLAAPDPADEILLADTSDTNTIKKSDIGAVIDSRLSGGTGITYSAGTVSIDGTVVLQHSDVDDTPVDAATDVPISSNWAYDHNAASTGTHGAGAETLLHTGSTIDGGSF